MRPVERSRSLHAGCFIKRETVTVWPQFPALGWRVFSLRGTVQLSSGREEEGCCSRLLWSSAKPRVVALLRGNAPCLCPAEQHLGRNSRSTAPCCLCLPACLPGQFQASLFPSHPPSHFISPSPLSFLPMFITE